MIIPAWVQPYVGLPWSGCGRDRTGVDCWGLLRLVYAEHYRLELPSFLEQYSTKSDREEVSSLIRQELPRSDWRPVTTAEEGDGVLFRLVGAPWHCGVLVAGQPRLVEAAGGSTMREGLFLHVREGANACVEALNSSAWSRRVLGFYRHRRRP